MLCSQVKDKDHPLQVHHVISRTLLPTDLRNLVVLCRGCHFTVAHRNPIFFLEKFKRKRPDDYNYLRKLSIPKGPKPRGFWAAEYKRIFGKEYGS